MCAASHAHAIEYEVGFSYGTSVNIQELTNVTMVSDNSANVEGSIELKSPHKLLQLPWIWITATDKIMDTEQFVLNWRTTLVSQYGKVEAPSGFYFNAGNLKIDFIEPSEAESHKYQWNIALEATRNLNEKIDLYGGIGLQHEEEKIEYRLGDWKLSDHSSTTAPRFYLGLTYQISNVKFASNFNCQSSYDLRKNVYLQCGMFIPLNPS